MQFWMGNGSVRRARPERIAVGIASLVAGAGGLCSVDTARWSAG